MKTKSAKDIRIAELERQFHLFHIALCDVTENRADHAVKWFRHGTCKLGVVRATGAAGGMIIEMQDVNDKGPELIGVHYWEDWHESARRFCFDHPGDRHAENMLRALDAAAKYIRDEQNAFYAPKVAEACGVKAEETKG